MNRKNYLEHSHGRHEEHRVETFTVANRDDCAGNQRVQEFSIFGLEEEDDKTRDALQHRHDVRGYASSDRAGVVEALGKL